jgi:hypothetical protein
MNKKALSFSLTLMALAGFSLIVLQHDITQVSMQIPKMEESKQLLEQQIENLEIRVRSLKNPKRLFEEKEKQALNKLTFPHHEKVLALSLDKVIIKPTIEETKSLAPHLPLAKVFP